MRVTICMLVVLAVRIYDGIAQSNPDQGRRDSLIDTSITYVLEPFGIIEEGWHVDADNIFLTNGTRWDTEIYGTVLQNRNVKLEMYEGIKNSEEQRFGWILQTNHTAHTCNGSDRLRFKFQVQSAAVETQIALRLFDDSACYTQFLSEPDQLPRCQNASNLKAFDILDTVIQRKADDFSRQPYELEIETSDLDPSIDLRRIKGWEIVMVNLASELTETSETILELYLEEISCIGGSDFLGAPFALGQWANMESSLDSLERDLTWRHLTFNSEIAAELTTSELRPDGILAINYTIEQVEAWGGFDDWGYTAPGNAYWNLSQADVVALDYRIVEPLSLPGRGLMRFVMHDTSHCQDPCNAFSQERYYSFNPILNRDTGDDFNTILLPMDGSTENDASFWLTGWSGVFGNRQFDREYVTGYYFELVMDSQSEIGTLASGALEFSDIGAFGISNKTVLFPFDESQCNFEEGLLALSPSFKRIEFLGKDCCQLCSEDDECLYAVSSGRDCYLASEIDGDSMEIQNTGESNDFRVFTMEKKRGDFCTLCDCDARNEIIDCSSRDLPIVPKTFTPEIEFEPRTIDLSRNPRLAFIGDNSFTQLPQTIERLILPSNTTILTKNSLSQLLNLRDISFENEKPLALKNVIVDEAGAYDNICCSPGEIVLDKLQFCVLEEATPGIDSIYVPFTEFPDVGPGTVVITPQSDFLSEASESLEKCAEFCSITENCNYFQYDARFSNAVHLCYLLREVGGEPEERCCAATDFTEPEQEEAGWTTGYPPRTRRKEFNARVLFSSNDISLEESNGFKAQYFVRLGSNPTRGAVWIESKVSNGQGLNLEVTPARVVLYDSESTVGITVSAKGVERNTKSVVVVENFVESCDLAFSEKQGTQVFVEVIRPQNTVAIVLPVVSALVVVVLLVGWLYQRQLKRKNDAIWKVTQKELHFSDPPEVIGRGTFGLVLLAEYRGTKVAVKRAIPPRQRLRRGLDSMRISSPSQLFGKNSIEETKSASANPLSSGSGYGYMSSTSFKHKSWMRLKSDFISEMRILAKLRHPCITTVMGGVITKDVEPMLVMEYMEHKSLYELLQNPTFELDGSILLNILRDISQGLRFLHAADPIIVHGDLKAQNILVDRKFRAKVADFGLSQKQRLGATSGTLYWMAPELIRKQSTNSAETDIFAYGMILYEVYARTDPYEGLDPWTVLEQIADPAICLRPQIPETCPDEVRSLMVACLLDDPQRRPTAGEIDVRLGRAVADEVAPRKGRKGDSQSKRMSLRDVFPEKIATALEEGRDVEAEYHDEVTIFFSDIVSFTKMSMEMEPQKVADLLHRLYMKFDDLCEVHGCYKLETIGDAFLVVTNLVEKQPDDHAKRVALFAIDAIKAANNTLIDPEIPDKGYVDIRVGFHSGPIVADLVGNRNKKFTLFGDTINTASRMESTSEANMIQCSEVAMNLLREQAPDIETTCRGTRSIKGKGYMRTYWVGEVGQAIEVPKASFKEESVRRHSAPDDLSMLQWALKLAGDDDMDNCLDDARGATSAAKHVSPILSKHKEVPTRPAAERRVTFTMDIGINLSNDIEAPGNRECHTDPELATNEDCKVYDV